MWQYNYCDPNELYHHGVLGMKWGHRKAVSVSAIANRGLAANARGAAKVYGKLGNKALSSAERSEAAKYSKRADSAQAAADAKKANKKPMSDKTKRALKIGAAAAGTALAAYGAYKVSKIVKGKAVSMGQVHAERILNKQGVTDPVLRTAALNKRYNADKNMSFAKAANRVFNKSSYNYGLV